MSFIWSTIMMIMAIYVSWTETSWLWLSLLLTIAFVALWIAYNCYNSRPLTNKQLHYSEDYDSQDYDPNSTDSRWHW
jgi:nitrate/nitrite transporter NarK